MGRQEKVGLGWIKISKGKESKQKKVMLTGEPRGQNMHNTLCR